MKIDPELKKRKRKLFVKRIIAFTLTFYASLFVFGIIGFMLVFHGPLTDIKELFVTSAMTTLNHQYLAEWLVGKDEVNRIMEKNKIVEPEGNTDTEKIVVKPVVKNAGPEDGLELVPISGPGYKGYLLIVSDPSRVSIAATDELGSRGMKVEELVKENKAFAGINAGGFADDKGHGSGGTPQGFLVSNSKILFADNSRTYHLIGFNRDNVLVLGNFNKQQIIDMGIRDAVTFKPFLIVNGEPAIKEGNGGWGIAPRTVIGQRRDGAVLMLVIDGRQLSSAGATLKDAQDIMLKYGAYNASNLDGGSSTTMYYKDKVINSPCSTAGARYVPSAFIVKDNSHTGETVLR